MASPVGKGGSEFKRVGRRSRVMAGRAKGFGGMQRLSERGACCLSSSLRSLSSTFGSPFSSFLSSLSASSHRVVTPPASFTSRFTNDSRSPGVARRYHVMAYESLQSPTSETSCVSAAVRTANGLPATPQECRPSTTGRRWWTLGGIRHRHVSPNKYTSLSDRDPKPLEIQRAQIVTKMTRYQDEASRICGKRWADITRPELDFVDKTLDEEVALALD
eukprot:755748-Hanusia_phi.AAC.9